eukprot:NODE_575_length_6553_cov_0.185156.p1 type:complete len:646 gc:universal NODE_575_length_6553_cov_0.185156:2482-4419(+)
MTKARILVASMWLPLSPIVPASSEKKHFKLERKLSVYVKEQDIKQDAIHLESAKVGNGGLINAIESVPEFEHVWIGALHTTLDQYEERQQHQIKDALLRNSCIAVDITKDQLQGFYHHFCKVVLWPLFHYTQPDYMTITKYEDHNWQMYQTVNWAYATQIAECYQENDVIFINDYHLMLVPQMVRSLLPDAKIGFFLHVPFPSSEIFRCLWVRDQILMGPTGADLIGFQTYSFARHFLQTCSRLLNLDTTPNYLRLPNSVVSIGICPMGVDVDSLKLKLLDPKVIEDKQSLLLKYKNKKVIFGRDKLDTIKGVSQKLMAFELFLNMHPEWVGKVVLIQVALFTSDESEMRVHVMDTVSRINTKFGNLEYMPVNFLHQNIEFSNYLALMSIADVCLITPLRDGLNLTSHEYVTCQGEKYSPLILSEFAGTFGSFSSAIRVNPWDRKEVALALNEALCMSMEEKQQRWELLNTAVCRYSAQRFVRTFIKDIEEKSIDMQKRYSSHIPHLNKLKITENFHNSKKRMIFLDLEGTIIPTDKSLQTGSFNNLDDKMQPKINVDTLLKNLCADPRNIIYIISSKRVDALDSRFKDFRLNLVAENGCFIKHIDQEWECRANEELEWRDQVLDSLEYYTEVINTNVENTWILY